MQFDISRASREGEIARGYRAGASRRELVRAARGTELPFDPPEFKIMTGALGALFLRDGESVPNLEEGRPVLSGTTSSTDVDLYTSRMAPRVIDQMRRDFPGMTTFLNHDYMIPESILGSMVRADVVPRRGEDGRVYRDLDIVSTVVGEEVNPRAMACWRGVRGGVRLGWSIGALVLDWEWQLPDGTPLKTDTTDDWSMFFPPTEDAVLTIMDILSLESSLVGIPANRRSWVAEAALAVARAGRAWQVGQVQAHRGLSLRAADAAAVAAREARAREYQIGVQAGGNASRPAPWIALPEGAWGDPVNYAYPMPDEAHAAEAASRWGDAAGRAGYTAAEQAIIGLRIAACQAHFAEGKKEKVMGETANEAAMADRPEVETRDLTPVAEAATAETAPAEAAPAEAAPAEAEAEADLDPVTIFRAAVDLVLRGGKEFSQANRDHLVEGHDQVAHALNMRCCGLGVCAGHEADLDYSGRSGQGSNDAQGDEHLEPSEDRGAAPDLTRQVTLAADLAAAEHLLERYKGELDAARVQRDLMRAELRRFEEILTRAENVPVAPQPTLRPATPVDITTLSYSEQLAQAGN